MANDKEYRPGDGIVVGSEQEDTAILLALLEANRLRADAEFEEPDYTLSQNGTGFAPRGNIMALMAEMKHGKTFVNTTFAATILRGEYMGLKAEIENGKVMFFDTEQDKADGQRIQRRVQYINGWDFKDDESHKHQFSIYHLRELPFDQRRKLIDFAVNHFRPDVVLIDGVRDLLQDFNSLEESADLIQWLMELSSKCQCAIWTVLHVNPNSDKMRGHLGTELGNKTTDVFRVTKQKDKNTGLVTFDVEHVAARHRDVDGWTFKINDGKPYGIPELLTEADTQELTESKVARAEELRQIMRKYIHEPAAISKTRLKDALTTGEHIGGSKAWKMIDEAIGLDALESVIGGKYRVKNAETTNEEADMPF